MLTPQFILDLNRELFVDNFAGGGGASTGIEIALGRHVDHAINHDRHALGMHRINHPQTIHHCEDVFDVDPATLCEGRPIGGAWFSPDCKHFSKAKGGKPLSKKIRGLAFVMLRYAKYRARVIYMENVEEIQTWGPLQRNGHPQPKHRGRTWQAFKLALSTGVPKNHPDLAEMLDVLNPKGGPPTVTREELIRGFGYQVETRELRACDYGAPTIRKRLFMIARCDGRPIVWPEPTHADPRKQSRLKPWRTAAECIDWSIPCNSIFLTQAEGRLHNCRRPLAASTLRRIATGIDRYVLKAQPFIVRLQAPFINEHANGTHQRTFKADEPLRTQCAEVKGGHFSLVSGSLVRTAHGEMDKNGKKRGRGAHSLGEPMPSVLASSDCALVSAHMMVNTTAHPGAPAGHPAPTVPTGGHHALIAGTLVQTGYGEREGQAPRALDPNKPLGTTVAGGAKHAAVAANLVKLRGGLDHPPAKPLNEPPHTASAGGNHHGLSVAYLAQHNNTTNVGHPATVPLSTISGKGSQQQVVAANLAAYYGSETDGQPLNDPLRTVSTKPRFCLSESVMARELTPLEAAGARCVAAFLREHGVQLEGEFATVNGMVIVDIGMRMLTPRELFRAQGFHDSYVIDQAWMVDPQSGEVVEIILTKEQQIRMCGNSVCPDVAAALVAANSPDLAVNTRRKIHREKSPA